MTPLRGSERLLVLYFAYVPLVALLLPVRAETRTVVASLNFTIIAGYVLLAYADSLRGRLLLGVIRDWFPLPLTLLAYREMGWLAPLHHTYRLEHSWIVWDKFLLNNLGFKAAVEVFGAVLPCVLELAYSLVYAIPFLALSLLYATRARERVDRFLFPFLLGVLACYILFPFFPSEPPRTVFPGEDFPLVNTIFRRFNWWLLGGYGIHTSVFPSAHVSGAFSAAFAMMKVLPEKKWAGYGFLTLAVLIAAGTVYGRYHYVADALAGFAISLVAAWIAFVYDRRKELTTSSE